MERERTEPVDLCDARGRLNPEARGWSRRPDLRANLRGAWGRKKRWDYWCVLTDEIVVACVAADIDYAGLANVWILDRAREHHAMAAVLRPLARGISLPEQACTGTVVVEDRALRLRIEERADHTRLVASAPRSAGGIAGAIDVDVVVAKPPAHESLNVVVPWSDRRFQFTSKHNTRPATGTVRVGDRRWTVDASHDAWGVQDLGRGIWKYANRWNWASASGRADDGRTVGLQFGGKWTVGTGATENGLCIDGTLSKLGEEHEWTYDWSRPLRPWRVRTVGSDRVDVTLTPTFDRYENTDLGLLKMEVHQCFGTWSGRVVGDDGRPLELRGLLGFAEEARNRW